MNQDINFCFKWSHKLFKAFVVVKSFYPVSRIQRGFFKTYVHISGLKHCKWDGMLF